MQKTLLHVSKTLIFPITTHPFCHSPWLMQKKIEVWIRKKKTTLHVSKTLISSITTCYPLFCHSPWFHEEENGGVDQEKEDHNSCFKNPNFIHYHMLPPFLAFTLIWCRGKWRCESGKEDHNSCFKNPNFLHYHMSPPFCHSLWFDAEENGGVDQEKKTTLHVSKTLISSIIMFLTRLWFPFPFLPIRLPHPPLIRVFSDKLEQKQKKTEERKKERTGKNVLILLFQFIQEI